MSVKVVVADLAGTHLARPFDVRRARFRYYLSQDDRIMFVFDPPTSEVALEVQTTRNGELVRRSLLNAKSVTGIWQRPHRSDILSKRGRFVPLTERLQSVCILDDGGDDGDTGDDGTDSSDTTYQCTADVPDGVTDLTNVQGDTCSEDQWNNQITQTAQALNEVELGEAAAGATFCLVGAILSDGLLGLACLILGSSVTITDKAKTIILDQKQSKLRHLTSGATYAGPSLMIVPFQSAPSFTRGSYKILITNELSNYDGYMCTLNGVASIAANYYPDNTVLGDSTQDPPSYYVVLGGTMFPASAADLETLGLSNAQWVPTACYGGFLVTSIDGTILQDPRDGTCYVFYGGASWWIPDPQNTIPLLGLDLLAVLNVPLTSAGSIIWSVTRVGTLVRQLSDERPYVCVSADYAGQPGVIEATNGYFQEISDPAVWDSLGGPSATRIIPDGSIT